VVRRNAGADASARADMPASAPSAIRQLPRGFRGFPL